MTSKELEGLARASCAWLAYRHIIDATGVYERLLLIPICEFLAANSAWKPANELAYRDLFRDRTLPDYYADIVAHKKGGTQRFVLETKLLRDFATKQWNKIERDVFRLVMPTGNLARYFLLAGPQKYFEIQSGFRPEKNSEFFKRLLSFGYSEGFEFDVIDNRDNKTKRSYVRKCSDVRVSVDREETYRLVIWSVTAGRSLSSRKKPMPVVATLSG